MAERLETQPLQQRPQRLTRAPATAVSWRSQARVEDSASPVHLQTLGGYVQLITEVLGDVGVIRVRGEVDAIHAPSLSETAFEMLGDGARSLVIDCRDIEFIDSAGLQAMLQARNGAQTQGGTVTIRRPSAHVCRLLQITGLDTVMLVGGVAEPDRRPADSEQG